MPRDPEALTRDLLGRTADEIEPLLVWHDRATYRVTVGGRRFVVKTDDDHATVAREAEGQRRAAAAGVPVPELVAVAADAFAMTWVDGVALHAHSTPAAWSDAGAQLRVAHGLGSGTPFGAGFGGFDEARPSWREFFEVFAEHQLRSCERDLDFPAEAATRIRGALRAAAPLLDAPHLGWCHGDLQPEHVIVDPATDRVAAIIDWADHGSGDVAWDITVLSLEDDAHLDAFLAGYGAGKDLRVALDRSVPLLQVVRLLGEAGWSAERDLPYADQVSRAVDWRSPPG